MDPLVKQATHQTLGLQICVHNRHTRQEVEELADNILYEMVFDSTPVCIEIVSILAHLGDTRQLVDEGENAVWTGEVEIQLKIFDELVSVSPGLEAWATHLDDWYEELNVYLKHSEDEVVWARVSAARQAISGT